MIYQVIYTDIAKSELSEIYEYIAYDLREPVNAKKQIDRIRNKIKILDKFPFRHKIYELKSTNIEGIRCLYVDNYIVFYYPNDESGEVSILRIIYKGRSFKNMFMEGVPDY